jgi:hypothetical protein
MGARAVAVPSTFNVGLGFSFGGGAAAQGNSSVKDNYLVSNMVFYSSAALRCIIIDRYKVDHSPEQVIQRAQIAL